MGSIIVQTRLIFGITHISCTEIQKMLLFDLSKENINKSQRDYIESFIKRLEKLK